MAAEIRKRFSGNPWKCTNGTAFFFLNNRLDDVIVCLAINGKGIGLYASKCDDGKTTVMPIESADDILDFVKSAKRQMIPGLVGEMADRLELLM